MSAFSPSDLPDSINTVEKLHIWSCMVLQHLNPELTVIEVNGALDRAMLSQPWFITATNPPVWRNISRSSIQLNSNWQRGGKLWTYAQELSSATIPGEFKTN
jgi:hypothetical protein